MGRALGPNGTDPVTVSLGSLLSQTVTPPNTTQKISDWTLYTYIFTVTTAGSYTLNFSGTLPYSTQSDHTSFIDNVSLVSVVGADATHSTQAFVPIINPSFEDNQLSDDTYTTSKGTLNPLTGIPGWTFNSSASPSYSGIATENGTIFGSPKYIPQGWQAAFIQGTGSFSQSVTFNTTGMYVIRFRSEGRSNAGSGANTIAVTVDGNNLGTFTPVTTGWTLFTSTPFTATAGIHTVAFTGTIPYTTSDCTSFIDDVQIVTPAESIAVIPPTSPVYDIVFIGDSITYGATLANPARQASAVQCMESLGQNYNVAVNMSNQGVSGKTTVDWQPTNSSGFFSNAVAAAATLESTQPGQLIFSIMLGTNDSAVSGPTGAPVSDANYLSNMEVIVNQLLVDYPNAYVFIHYPTWYSPNTENSSVYLQAGLTRLQTYFPEINQVITDFATTNPGHVFLGDTQAFDFFENSYSAANNYTPYMTGEPVQGGAGGTFYLHPNAAGAVILGTYWANAMDAALNFTPNNSYGAWLQSDDMTPGASGTGFGDTPANALVSNGLAYSNPNGMITSIGTSPASVDVTADIRTDPSLTFVLQDSTDLVNWSPLTWSVAPSQTGVATGFIRYTLQDPIDYSLTKKFYRLQFTY
jgi:lysophospholipase L1-like esterase